MPKNPEEYATPLTSPSTTYLSNPPAPAQKKNSTRLPASSAMTTEVTIPCSPDQNHCPIQTAEATETTMLASRNANPLTLFSLACSVYPNTTAFVQLAVPFTTPSMMLSSIHLQALVRASVPPPATAS